MDKVIAGLKNIDIKYVVVRPEIDKDREPAPLEVCEVRFEVMSALNKYYYEHCIEEGS